MGRPTKYDPRFCDEARRIMAQGFSVKAFAGQIGVNVQTVYNWMNQYPDFFDAIKDGQAAAAEWWERTLMQVAATGEGSAAAAIFGVKNRSQEEWKDKVEQDHTSSDGSMKTPTRIEVTSPNDKGSD